MSTVREVFDDLNNLDLPEDDNAFDKIKGAIKNGTRVYWYYQEDVDYANEYCDGISPRDYPPFSGIAIAKPGMVMFGELEIHDCIIVLDNHPAEKCYPESDWIALPKLLNASDLVEIFTREDK